MTAADPVCTSADSEAQEISSQHIQGSGSHALESRNPQCSRQESEAHGSGVTAVLHLKASAQHSEDSCEKGLPDAPSFFSRIFSRRNPQDTAASTAEAAEPPATPPAPKEVAAPTGPGFASGLRLGFSRTCYSMAQALGLKRLQDYVQGAGKELSPDSPVWLLGVEHKPHPPQEGAEASTEASHQAALADFSSRLWMTYRRDFLSIGATGLTSDVGWGCTLRSGQMLLAEGLMRHMMGRSWRAGGGTGQPSELTQLLRWLHDSPSTDSPFSVHNLCSAEGVNGVRPGEWLGPWVLCHALEAAIMKARPLGIAAHVLAEPGGGAPTLHPASVLEKVFLTGGDLSGDGQAAPTQEGNGDSEAAKAASALLVLLPLTLGIGQVNPRYAPQLQAVLTWPQSIGIIGGRPSSSLYFVGFQDDNVLFLDPHESQPVVPDADIGDVTSYHCSTPRLMPLQSIDPSLAIGFYCRSADSFRELCNQLADLEVQSAGAPLVSIARGEAPTPGRWHSTRSASDADKGEEWEIL